MLDKLKIWGQFLLPQHLLSRLLGVVAELEWAWLKNKLIRWFVKVYDVDLSEAIETEIEAYPTFNSFFTRALKSDARQICLKPNSIVCPADGILSQFGTVTNGEMIQAKGRDYSLEELIGGNREWAMPFMNGRYFTVYLAPNNYHRVHMPLAGMLEKMIYVPGRLFSVNQLTAQHVPNLFARNERVISIFHCTNKYNNETVIPIAIVLVGAMVVGGIHTTWAGQVTPPHGYSKVVSCYYQNWGNAIVLEKGDQMGHFCVGSTAIVLIGSDAMQWSEGLRVGQQIQMGEGLGFLG